MSFAPLSGALGESRRLASCILMRVEVLPVLLPALRGAERAAAALGREGLRVWRAPLAAQGAAPSTPSAAPARCPLPPQRRRPCSHAAAAPPADCGAPGPLGAAHAQPSSLPPSPPCPCAKMLPSPPSPLPLLPADKSSKMPDTFNMHPKKHGQGAFWHVWCVVAEARGARACRRVSPRSLTLALPLCSRTPHPAQPQVRQQPRLDPQVPHDALPQMFP